MGSVLDCGRCFIGASDDYCIPGGRGEMSSDLVKQHRMKCGQYTNLPPKERARIRANLDNLKGR